MRGGRVAVSTRAVSAAAGVQAPAIYRQLGDMQQLLHAAAREVLARYVRQKADRVPGADPLEDLRRGWDHHVAFGLANPDAYALLYTGNDGPGASERAAAPEHQQGIAILEGLVARLAAAGRLRVPVPHAASLIHAAGSGVVLTLVATPPAERDPHLSPAMRELVIAGITVAGKTKPARGGASAASHAIALRAAVHEGRGPLSSGEQQLLGEWLDRIASDGLRR